MAAMGYSFFMTMAILIVLEPLMFLARKRSQRSIRGNGGMARRVEDRGSIREEIPMFVIHENGHAPIAGST
jgi:hypothetical protein